MIMIGKNTDYKIVFNCESQAYTVYYKDNFLIGNKFKFQDVKSYLD